MATLYKAASNQSSEKVVEKNGNLNLYLAAISIRPPFACPNKSFPIVFTSIQ